jgi:hypothetical protein
MKARLRNRKSAGTAPHDHPTRDNRGRKLIPLLPILQAIRDVASGAGDAPFATVLHRVGTAQPELVKAVDELAQRGLIAVDRASWTLMLTKAGHAELPPAGEPTKRPT